MLLKGYRSIYLGSSIPLENLKVLQSNYEDITFISYFTIEPSIEKVNKYLEEINEDILSIRDEHFHISGRNTKDLDLKSLPTNIHVHSNIVDLIKRI